jgi:hypothetical protein
MLVSEHEVAGSVAVHVPPAPSLTLTVPVGVPAPGAVTFSVKPAVYGWPTTDGSGASVSELSDVLALLTVCDAEEELTLKFASLAYEAVIVFAPAVVDVKLHVPLPAASVIEHVAPVPSLTFTVPDGVPAPGTTGATLTFTAYDCPTTVGVPASVAEFVIVVVVFALLTVCETPAEVLERKFTSPE